MKKRQTVIDGFTKVSKEASSVATKVKKKAKLPQRPGVVNEMPKEYDGFKREHSETASAATSFASRKSAEDLPVFNEKYSETSSEGTNPLTRLPKITKKRILIGLSGILFLAIVAFGIHVKNSISKSLRGGGHSSALFGDVEPGDLNKEGDGRVNILLIGIGGANHDGGNLADTIMIGSLDAKNNQVSLISIPRDYYVESDDGSYKRINQITADCEEVKIDSGPECLVKEIENDFDIPLHYYVRLDFTAFKEAVDTVGGIDVNVHEHVKDSSLAWILGQPLEFEPGIHHMDGETALYYSRARYAEIGGTDFARTQRQKEVITALFNKTLSLGTFSSPAKIQGLMSAFSDNLVSNLGLSEVNALYGVGKNINPDTINNATISYEDDDGNPLLEDYTDPVTGAQVLLPAAGAGDNSDVANYIKSKMQDPYLLAESPVISIYNASGIDGLAVKYQKMYRAMGYTVKKASNYGSIRVDTEVVEFNEKPFTRNFLLKRFGLTKTGDQSLAKDDNSAENPVDYVIILGSDAE